MMQLLIFLCIFVWEWMKFHRLPVAITLLPVLSTGPTADTGSDIGMKNSQPNVDQLYGGSDMPAMLNVIGANTKNLLLLGDKQGRREYHIHSVNFPPSLFVS